MTDKSDMINITAEDLKTDWRWVKDQLIKLEKIPSSKNSEPKNAITECLDECLEDVKSLSSPKMALARKKIARSGPGFIEIEGGITLSSESLATYIKGASHLYFFLVTIGGAIEDKATSWMSKSDHLRGYFLDRIGSLAVESLAENMEARLRKDCESKGQSISMRFSPGYCNWPIEEQFKLKKILDFAKADVSLTESCMMIPRKSISAVVGMGPKGVFSKTKSQCVICDKKDCDYRRVGSR